MTSAYSSWQRDVVRAHGLTLRVATKPGVPAHGQEHDPSVFLAESASIAPGERVVVMNAGGAAPAAVAAMRAGPTGAVQVFERNAVAAEAVDRTIGALEAGAIAPVSLVRGVTSQVSARAAEREADGASDVVLLRVPFDRASVSAAIDRAWRTLRAGGRCYLAGANHEGIKSAATALERVFGNARVVANARGMRVVLATRDDSPAPRDAADETGFHAFPVTLRGHTFTVFTRPGVFSWEHLDEATSLLANAMEIPAGARVLDLGCGAGVLGTLAALLGAGETLMLDADVEAVRSAAETARAAGATGVEALASDVTSAAGERRFDVIVCNPPFHTGRETDLLLPREFLRQAHERLVIGGALYLVANRTLPYEAVITSLFGASRVVHDGARFKVLRADRRS